MLMLPGFDETARRDLISALMGAFSTARDLEAAVGQNRLDLVDLDGAKLTVFTNVVNHANSNEWVTHLIKAAVRAVPRSEPLRQLGKRLGIPVPPPPPPEEEDFLIRVTEQMRGYVTEARSRSGVSAAGSPTPMPARVLRHLPEIQDILLSNSGPTRGVIGALNRRADRITLRDLGQDVFAFLMQGDVRTLFNQSRREATHAGRRLRIRLDLEGAPAVAHIPWELAFDSAVDDHLCLLDPTPVSRAVEVEYDIRRSSRPLRILGMVARPAIAGLAAGLQEASFAREQAAISDALKDLGAERATLHWTTSGTRSDLRRMLRRPPGAEGWGVFHFIGHGEFDPEEGEGFLLLQEAGGVARLSGTDLKRLAATVEGAPQLVVLNCCSGARTAPGLSFASVAERLVRAGIPAVIAMQFEVTEEAAQTFSRALYEAIAEGETIGAALTIARIELSAGHCGEWVTPALYTSCPDFALVERAP
jgi:hypothetical protein